MEWTGFNPVIKCNEKKNERSVMTNGVCCNHTVDCGNTKGAEYKLRIPIEESTITEGAEYPCMRYRKTKQVGIQKQGKNETP